MDSDQDQTGLASALRLERRKRRLSLRDLSAEIGVSFNTLSRVERGHLPDLKNYERIVRWLGVPASTFLEPRQSDTPTTELIAKHLFSDARLTPENAEQIAQLVQEMYEELAIRTPTLRVHMRSAKTFLPSVGIMLAEALDEMQNQLLAEER